MTEATKSKWAFDDAVRRGEEALRLAGLYREPLERRLKAGAIETLVADVRALQQSPAERQAAMTGQKGKTGDERDIADDGLDWVMSIRELAKRTGALSDGVLKALGVGEKVDAASTNSVRGAIKAILDKLQEAQDLVSVLGLVPEDLEDGRQLYDELGGADSAQSESMASGKGMTFNKNTVQLRVEAKVDEISSRGQMAFRKDKVVRGLFEALVSGSGPAPKSDTPTPTT